MPPNRWTWSIDLIERLQERGAVYPVDDPEFADLYFAQSSDPAFGSLAKLDEAEAVRPVRRAGRGS